MDTLKMHSLDGVQRNIELIGKLFPNAITEVKRDGKVEHAIDFDVLRQELSGSIVEGREERYQFTWPDKKKAMLAANAPITATLRPVVADSVGKDGTPGGFDSENLYIEGDNLEVLKLLQETYLGKVKMIYIDPPYNTGNDFVYEDDFAQSTEDYMGNSGQYDEEGNRMVTNTESNGRFHTDWLNMIYPRLKLAKSYLTNDGVIFISIDDGEVENLKKLCDEIFGTDNYINTICLKLKNIAGASGGGEDKRLKKNMEYILVYAKNYRELVPFKNVYQYTPISKMVEEYRNAGISWKYTTALVNPGEKIYVGSTFDGDGLEIKIYKRIGFIIKSVGQIMKEENLTEKEVYDRYAYCIYQTAMPQSSIRPRVMEKVRQIGIESDLYSIEYVPKTGRNKGNTYEQFYKGENFRLFAWLKDVAEEINGILYKKDLQGTLWDFVGETKNLTKEGDVPFPNGKKPVRLLKQMLTMLTSGNDYVLDFFSGSSTTAHAVMQLNAEDGGHRKFIMVQLPEKTDEKSEAYKAGYKNICEIGKERIRRAGRKIKEDAGLTAPADLDIGFRCLRLDSSNMENVYYTPEETRQQDLFSLVDNVKPDRTPEDLLFQVMLDLGVLLSSPIEVKEIAGKKVFNVADGFLLACFDHDVTEETVKAIAQMKPYYAVFRDSSMANDSVATNFDQIFETYSPETVRKVL